MSESKPTPFWKFNLVLMALVAICLLTGLTAGHVWGASKAHAQTVVNPSPQAPFVPFGCEGGGSCHILNAYTGETWIENAYGAPRDAKWIKMPSEGGPADPNPPADE